MLKRYERSVGNAFRVIDAIVIGATWLLSYWIRFNVPIIEVTKGFPSFETYAALLPLVIAIWVTTFSTLKIYQSGRILRRTHEAHRIIQAHFVSMLIFIAITYMFSEYRYSRVVMIYFGLIGGSLLVGARLIARNALRSFRKEGHYLRRVLAVGEGPTVETLIHKMDRFPELGLNVIGVATHRSSQATVIQKKPVIGYLDQVAELIEKNNIDQVVLALPKEHYKAMESILSSIRDETVDIQLVPDVHEYITLGCEVEDFEGFPIVNLNDSPLDGWGAAAKRVTDLILSLFALIILAPLLLLIAGLVKLTSRGPILYSQERMGLDGSTFKMWKFRSMVVGAENKTGATWAQKDDERRTLIGAILRSTSMDELPQLWNVLRGDMSLVGPRPERPVFVHKFRDEIPHYMLRHKVKAGITGWAQINGWRGNTSLDRRIECDLYYIRNWSYLLDLKILIMTVWRGLLNKNAY